MSDAKSINNSLLNSLNIQQKTQVENKERNTLGQTEFKNLRFIVNKKSQ